MLQAVSQAFNASQHLIVEAGTGTGKTYCYIKSIFEMNKRYGWSKFIVVVPSIAIREGVFKSLDITAEHFTESYGKKVRFFIYISRQLHHLESFSSDAGINVMVINIQAFNATGKDNRRIYDELDDFQSRRPIDVISSNRPIVILDEPMSGLDPLGRKLVIDIVLELKERGKTVFFCSHILSDVENPLYINIRYQSVCFRNLRVVDPDLVRWCCDRRAIPKA